MMDLLFYKIQIDSVSQFVSVQSIENIFEAKRSYEKSGMSRTKDLVHSQKLKELNFNLF